MDLSKIYNREKYEKHRNVVIETKSGAVWISTVELQGLINLSGVAREYFNKSQSWLSQRIHGCMVMKKKMAFKEAEYAQFAAAYRDIAARLLAHADEIDRAALDDYEED